MSRLSLRRLFDRVDYAGEGQVAREDLLEEMLADPDYGALLGLDIYVADEMRQDLEEIFHAWDGGDDLISFDEFAEFLKRATRVVSATHPHGAGVPKDLESAGDDIREMRRQEAQRQEEREPSQQELAAQFLLSQAQSGMDGSSHSSSRHETPKSSRSSRAGQIVESLHLEPAAEPLSHWRRNSVVSAPHSARSTRSRDSRGSPRRNDGDRSGSDSEDRRSRISAASSIRGGSPARDRAKAFMQKRKSEHKQLTSTLASFSGDSMASGNESPHLPSRDGAGSRWAHSPFRGSPQRDAHQEQQVEQPAAGGGGGGGGGSGGGNAGGMFARVERPQSWGRHRQQQQEQQQQQQSPPKTFGQGMYPPFRQPPPQLRPRSPRFQERLREAIEEPYQPLYSPSFDHTEQKAVGGGRRGNDDSGYISPRSRSPSPSPSPHVDSDYSPETRPHPGRPDRRPSPGRHGGGGGSVSGSVAERSRQLGLQRRSGSPFRDGGRGAASPSRGGGLQSSLQSRIEAAKLRRQNLDPLSLMGASKSPSRVSRHASPRRNASPTKSNGTGRPKSAQRRERRHRRGNRGYEYTDDEDSGTDRNPGDDEEGKHTARQQVHQPEYHDGEQQRRRGSPGRSTQPVSSGRQQRPSSRSRGGNAKPEVPPATKKTANGSGFNTSLARYASVDSHVDNVDKQAATKRPEEPESPRAASPQISRHSRGRRGGHTRNEDGDSYQTGHGGKNGDGRRHQRSSSPARQRRGRQPSSDEDADDYSVEQEEQLYAHRREDSESALDGDDDDDGESAVQFGPDGRVEGPMRQSSQLRQRLKTASSLASATSVLKQLGAAKQERVGNTAAAQWQQEEQETQMRRKKDKARERLTTAGHTVVATNRFGSHDQRRQEQEQEEQQQQQLLLQQQVPDSQLLPSNDPGSNSLSLQLKAQQLKEKRRRPSSTHRSASPTRSMYSDVGHGGGHGNRLVEADYSAAYHGSGSPQRSSSQGRSSPYRSGSPQRTSTAEQIQRIERMDWGREGAVIGLGHSRSHQAQIQQQVIHQQMQMQRELRRAASAHRASSPSRGSVAATRSSAAEFVAELANASAARRGGSGGSPAPGGRGGGPGRGGREDVTAEWRYPNIYNRVEPEPPQLGANRPLMSSPSRSLSSPTRSMPSPSPSRGPPGDRRRASALQMWAESSGIDTPSVQPPPPTSTPPRGSGHYSGEGGSHYDEDEYEGDGTRWNGQYQLSPGGGAGKRGPPPVPSRAKSPPHQEEEEQQQRQRPNRFISEEMSAERASSLLRVAEARRRADSPDRNRRGADRRGDGGFGSPAQLVRTGSDGRRRRAETLAAETMAGGGSRQQQPEDYQQYDGESRRGVSRNSSHHSRTSLSSRFNQPVYRG